MPKSVRMPDGNIINFPDDMDDKTIHAEGLKYVNSLGKQAIPAGVSMMGPSNQYKGLGDEAIDVLRPIVAGAAGTSAAAIPFPGTGPAAYTGADYLMQLLKSEKSSPTEKLINTGVQAILGKVLGGLLKVPGAMRNSGMPDPEIIKFNPTASQALKSEGLPGSGVAKFLEDNFATSAKTQALKNSGGRVVDIGDVLAGKFAGRSPSTIRNPQQMADLITGELAPAAESKMVAGKLVPIEDLPEAYQLLPGVTKKVPFATDSASLDKLLADPKQLQMALTKSQSAGLGINVKQDLAGYRFSRLLHDATRPDGTVDVSAMKSAFSDPMMTESNKILFNSTARSNIEQFFKNAEFVQDKVSPNPALKRIMYYSDGIGLTYSLFSQNPIKMGITGGIIGLQLGGAALAKAFTKPETARILIRLAGAEPLGMSDGFAGKIITQALNGSAISLIDGEGNKHPARIEDGKIVGQ